MPVRQPHPYQNFELEKLPGWQHLRFNDDDREFYELAACRIEASFQATLQGAGLFDFFTTYLSASWEILEKSGWDPTIFEIMGEACSRLIFYYLFFKRKKREALAKKGSSIRWRIDAELLKHAREIADRMERDGVRVSAYYKLTEDPELFRWVSANVRPVIEEFVGSTAFAPHAHIRVVDTASFKHTWEHMFQEHPFGHFHWDELCYSIPFIIYLEKVGDDDGPYAYVEGSDKIPQNLTMRAFAQAISCRLYETDKFDDKYKKFLSRLPRIFRSGEQVGSHVDPELFKRSVITTITGEAGTAVLSDGFSLVHAGGHPRAGRRKALFIAHRYPRKKILDVCAFAARMVWLLCAAIRNPSFMLNRALAGGVRRKAGHA